MKQRLIAAGADVVAVLVFVVLGRSSHDEGNGIASVLGVAAPFLIGVAIGWLVAPTPRVRPFAVRSGVQIWLAAVLVGVVLRWFAWDRGTALSFIIVAAVFLGLTIVGWRVAFAGASRPRGAVRSSRPPLEAER
jgi:hypothetical protein